MATRLPAVAVTMVGATLVNFRLTQISRVLPLALQEIQPISRRALRLQGRKTPSMSNQTLILITRTRLGQASVAKPIAPKANVTPSSIRPFILADVLLPTSAFALAHQRRHGVLPSHGALTSRIQCIARSEHYSIARL